MGRKSGDKRGEKESKGEVCLGEGRRGEEISREKSSDTAEI